MNISVPDDLRKRMDKASKSSEVNWSAIACRAFTDHVLAHEARQGKLKMSMSKVVERLKSEAAKEGNASEQAGHAAGVEWAQERATPAQLKRLAAADNGGVNNWHIGMTVDNSAYCDAERIAALILGTLDNIDRREADSFWEDAGMDQAAPADPASYVLGFCNGAMEVWWQVKDAI